MNNKNSYTKKFALPFYWFSGAAFCLLMVQNTAGHPLKVIIQTLAFIIAIGIVLFFNRDRIDISYLKVRDKADSGYYVFAIVFLAIAIPFFSKIWKNQVFRIEFLREFGISPEFVLKLLPYVLAAFAFPAFVCGLKYVMRDFLNIRDNVWESIKYQWKSIAVIAGIYCFSIISIIRADYIYKDDMQRLIGGVTVYGRESRFVGEFATFFLHFDEFFADSSPLPQILEMLIMAVFAVIVYYVIFGDKKPSAIGYLAMVPFALCPYFLECVSFKYDSPQHALAALFSVLPLLYWRRDRKQLLVSTIICIPLMCMSHQVMFMFYPSMVVLLCTLSLITGEWKLKDAAIMAGQTALAFIAGMSIYRFGILRVLPSGTGFTSTEVLGFKEIIPGVIKNYTDFFTTITEHFNMVWIGLILILCISFIFVLVRNAEIKASWAATLAIICLILLLAFSFSMYPILKYPLFSARHMYSFGMFIGLIAVVSVEMGEINILPKASVILLSTAFIVFAFIYGNALEQQKIYTEYRVEMVLDTLTEITSQHPETTYKVQIEGTAGYAPTIDAMPDSLGMVRTLVTDSFSEYYNEWWASGMCAYYDLNITFALPDEQVDFKKMNLPLIDKNYYHAIYADDENILVVLEDR